MKKKLVSRVSLNNRRRKAFNAVNNSISEELNRPVTDSLLDELEDEFDEIVYNLRTDFHETVKKDQFLAEFRNFMEHIHDNIY